MLDLFLAKFPKLKRVMVVLYGRQLPENSPPLSLFCPPESLEELRVAWVEVSCSLVPPLALPDQHVSVRNDVPREVYGTPPNRSRLRPRFRENGEPSADPVREWWQEAQVGRKGWARGKAWFNLAGYADIFDKRWPRLRVLSLCYIHTTCTDACPVLEDVRVRGIVWAIQLQADSWFSRVMFPCERLVCNVLNAGSTFHHKGRFAIIHEPRLKMLSTTWPPYAVYRCDECSCRPRFEVRMPEGVQVFLRIAKRPDGMGCEYWQLEPLRRFADRVFLDAGDLPESQQVELHTAYSGVFKVVKNVRNNSKIQRLNKHTNQHL